jgi:hypothetical protein
LRHARGVTDSSARFLETNLALLSAAAQQALRVTNPLNALRLLETGPPPHASIRTHDGRWVPVHTSDDPIAASDRVAARFADTAPPLLVVVGLGLGYLLDALERRGSTTNVLVIEPVPAITRAMLARRDWTSWLETGRLTMLVGPDYAGRSDIWSLFGRGTETPPVIMAPIIEREFREEAAHATALVRQMIAGVKANEHARRQFAGRYLRNTLTNIPIIAAEGDVAALAGTFPRVPAVVVGAGPSLDRNLADIAKRDGKILVIAVDTAVRPLLAAGIRPHLVVTVDPSELNAQHLKDLPDSHGLWLAAEASVDPVVFPQFGGRTFTFNVSRHHPWPWLDIQGFGRGTLRAWGSVLTTAFDLACHLGCDPIVFAGADLAYTRGLQYCRHTIYEDRWRDFPTDDARAEQFKNYLNAHAHLACPDVHGGEVLTTSHFVQFRDWIVSRAGEVPGRRIVNATGGGILHGGRIAQSAFSVLHLPKLSHDFDPQRHLTTAWYAGAETRRQQRLHLHAAISEPHDLPLATWLDFGGDTASAEQIDAAVAKARCALSLAMRGSLRIDNRPSAKHVNVHDGAPLPTPRQIPPAEHAARASKMEP